MSLGAWSVASAQTPPDPALVKIAPLKYSQRTLTNGLTVLAVENHQSPTVAIQVWYHVGGKDDPAGRSGFAHLFEHMMFKSTTNQKSENIDRLTGGCRRGEQCVHPRGDATVYHETVPLQLSGTAALGRGGPHGELAHQQRRTSFRSARSWKKNIARAFFHDPTAGWNLLVDANSFVWRIPTNAASSVPSPISIPPRWKMSGNFITRDLLPPG